MMGRDPASPFLFDFVFIFIVFREKEISKVKSIYLLPAAVRSRGGGGGGHSGTE